MMSWYPGSGVVLDCIVSIPDLCRLSYFVLASHRYCSTHCVDDVDIWEKNAVLQKLPLPRAVFLEGVRSTSESFGKPHLSLTLTN